MTQVSLEEFQQLDLRIGTVVQAEDHPNADRLVVLQVDLGTERRQLVAGIKQTYAPATLIGKQVLVVANLKPAMLRGVESQGMVLASHDDTRLALLTPDAPLKPGSIVK